MSKAKVNEPHWEPLPRQSFTPAQTAGIVVRHLVPVAGVFVLDWSAGEFVLLSVFNICFSIVCIGVIGVVVSTRQEIGPSPNAADAIGTWLFAMLLALVGSVLLTAMFGWVVALLMVSDGGNLFEFSLLVPALIMVVSAAPALYRQYTTDLVGGMCEGRASSRIKSGRKSRNRHSAVTAMTST